MKEKGGGAFSGSSIQDVYKKLHSWKKFSKVRCAGAHLRTRSLVHLALKLFKILAFLE